MEWLRGIAKALRGSRRFLPDPWFCRKAVDRDRTSLEGSGEVEPAHRSLGEAKCALIRSDEVGLTSQSLSEAELAFVLSEVGPTSLGVG